MTNTQITTNTPAATRQCATELAGTLRPGALLALYGDIGAGKTCFVQGLAKGLGITRPVVSPTFVILNEYAGRLPLYHMDLYRLPDADSILQAGLDEYFRTPGITVIEWAERAEPILPAHAIRIYLQNAGHDTGKSSTNKRIIKIIFKDI